MRALLVNFEYWLFSLLVRERFITTETMDRWIKRLRVQDGPLSEVTIYLNANLWQAQIRHPELRRVNTIEQLCAALEEDSSNDIVFMGTINSSTQRSLLVSGAKLVIEDKHV